MSEIYPSTKSSCILLATYNGERNIADQLDSILKQDNGNWILLARDDGSTDGTKALLESFAEKDDRIRLINDGEPPFGSPVRNFNALISAGLDTDCDIFFFCDQDDFWFSDKISRQLEVLGEMDLSSACLVHHDLEVVSQQLKQIHPSFFTLMNLEPASLTFANLLGRNEVTGCTIACNRILLELASPFPASVIMHDWWLALICSAMGEIRAMDATLVRYRQHDRNVVGAKSFWHGLNPFGNIFKTWVKGNEELRDTFSQAECLLRFLDTKNLLFRVPGGVLDSLVGYATILDVPRLKRISRCRELGLLKKHWFLNLLQKIRLLIL